MMTLDYFYEEILVPVCDWLGENIVAPMLNASLTALLWISLPFWIVPYLIVRKRRGGE